MHSARVSGRMSAIISLSLERCCRETKMRSCSSAARNCSRSPVAMLASSCACVSARCGLSASRNRSRSRSSSARLRSVCSWTMAASRSCSSCAISSLSMEKLRRRSLMATWASWSMLLPRESLLLPPPLDLRSRDDDCGGGGCGGDMDDESPLPALPCRWPNGGGVTPDRGPDGDRVTGPAVLLLPLLADVVELLLLPLLVLGATPTGPATARWTTRSRTSARDLISNTMSSRSSGRTSAPFTLSSSSPGLKGKKE